MKKLLLFFVISAVTICAQNNITNTVGTGGTFKVKDATNTFMTIEQSTGNVGLSKDPSYKLDVNGDLNISGNYKINGSNISAGNSFAEAFNVSSVITMAISTNFLGGTSLSNNTANERDYMRVIPISGTKIKLFVTMSGAINTSYTVTVRHAPQAAGNLLFTNTLAAFKVDDTHQYGSITVLQDFSAGDVFTVQLTGSQAFNVTGQSMAVTVVFE